MSKTKLNYPVPQGPLGPSYFNSVSSKEPKILTWDQIYLLITKDAHIEDTTAEARKYRDQGDTTAYAATKAKAGAITPAAQCQGGHNAANVIALTGISMVDLDHVPIDQLADTLAKVRADAHTFLCHITCSGQGVRILYRYTSKQHEIAYFDAWAWGNQYYSMLTGLEADKAVKDVSRLSFLSHDPQCYYNPQSEPFNVMTNDEALEEIKDPEIPAGSEAVALAQKIADREIPFIEGSRHKNLLYRGFLLNKMGMAANDIAEALKADAPRGDKEAEDIAHYVSDKASSDHGTWKGTTPKSHKVKRPTLAEATQDVRPQTDDVSRKTQDVRQKSATAAQIREYLEANELMRYNVISDTVELWSPEQHDFVAINDRIVNTIWQQCMDSLGLYVKDADMNKIITSEFVKSYNPFQEYFSNLPAWDGTDHIARVAATVKTTTQPHIFEECFRRWLVGMAASWLDPKVMNETILTLIGSQGMYKSTFFREIMPKPLSRYFMAKGNSSYITKDDRISVSNYGLITLDEIDSLKSADLNAVKALVTMETIDERAAYARNREKRPHLASFCATGNNKNFLTDLTGNRRWLPFEVVDIADPRKTFEHQEQLYAQVKHLIDSRYRFYFTREEDQALEEHKREFTEPCIEEELVQKFFRKPQKGEIGHFLTTTDIAARCNAELKGLISTKKVSQVMKRLGYPVRRTTACNGFIVVQRTYDEINMESIELATEVLRAEKAEKELATRQLTLLDEAKG